MCGIAGALVMSGGRPRAQIDDDVLRMTQRMIHRGPDGQGFWKDSTETIALGHRRLAIVDLTEQGRQPMSFAGGRYHITFNGEIYNFRELASELEAGGQRFTSTGDTQVLLAAIARWGLHGALRRAVGMFAFAVWDSTARTLHLARDRMGEKPLHIGLSNGCLYFASELSAFSVVDGFPRTIDGQAVSSYLRFGYMPEPLSIFEGIYKLPAGSTLSVPADARASEVHSRAADSDAGGTSIAPVPYWSCPDVARAGRSALIASEQQASAELEAQLREVIRWQMSCDVPIGCFLSGGIDSTVVASIMQKESASPIHTFTVRFEEPEFDESAHARAIADYLGTKHEEFVLSAREVAANIPASIAQLDEPTANGSFFAAQQISRLARTRATVVLSGDGGDELFAGYNRYHLTSKAWRAMRLVPRPARTRLQAALSRMDGQAASAIHRLLVRMLRLGDQASSVRTMTKIEQLLGANGLRECYDAVASCWPRSSALVTSSRKSRAWFPEFSDLSAMLLSDQVDYLPGDSLAKLDRASMSVSLETRLPLLDHRLVELSWRLPDRMRYQERKSKWLLRSVLDRHVPRSLTERRKMGFTVPVDQWLTGSLTEWACDMLGSARFRALLGPDHSTAMRAWQTYNAGRPPNGYQMWAMVVLAAWVHHHA